MNNKMSNEQYKALFSARLRGGHFATRAAIGYFDATKTNDRRYHDLPMYLYVEDRSLGIVTELVSAPSSETPLIDIRFIEFSNEDEEKEFIDRSDLYLCDAFAIEFPSETFEMSGNELIFKSYLTKIVYRDDEFGEFVPRFLREFRYDFIKKKFHVENGKSLTRKINGWNDYFANYEEKHGSIMFTCPRFITMQDVDNLEKHLEAHRCDWREKKRIVDRFIFQHKMGPGISIIEAIEELRHADNY